MRLCWTMTSTAELICSRMARTGRSMPAMSTIVSRRREHVARGVGVAGRQRAVVARVHRLEHVQRFATAALADDDALGPHAQALTSCSRGR